MHFNPSLGDMQIIAGQQRVKGGIVVNAFDGVLSLIVGIAGIAGRTYAYAMVFSHEPLQERMIQ